MDFQLLFKKYTTDPRTQNLASALKMQADVRAHLHGLVGSQGAFVAAATYYTEPQANLYILPNKEEAAYFMNDLKNIFEQRKDVLFFPDSFKKAGDPTELNKTNVLMRAETLSRLLGTITTGELIVTYPEAMFEKVVNTKTLRKSTIHVGVNEKMDAGFITELLVTYGFRRSDFVYEPGQFAIRGGIIDIYSYGNDLPYRVELFGDEVESIRVFDPLTQLSVKKITQVNIVPNIQTQFDPADKTSLFKLLPTNAAIWIKDMQALVDINQRCYDRAIEYAEKIKQEGFINVEDEESIFNTPNPASALLSSDDLLNDLLPFNIVELGGQSYFPKTEKITYSAAPQPAFNKNFNLLMNDLREKATMKFDINLLVSNPKQVERFYAIFDDLKADFQYTPTVIAIYSGFIDYDLKLVCYTDHQIFDRFYKYQMKQGYSKDKALTIKMLRDLQPGDYVTHIDHGIGVFSGLEQIEVMGKPQEVVRVTYKDNDVLYVSINSLHKISKYSGADGKPPKIHKLGSDVWEKTKQKVKLRIKVIAFDLIKLYAKRKASKGFAYAPDTYLQTELEASFIYEDTPDQLKATQDVKADMEAHIPMDRLVCGDVGFGKTEIAVRAAAKAVADSKQVAILVPTTILAMQHFQTFKDRLKDFPCNIDYLNRFKSAKEKRQTLDKLAKGEVDIIIGTHAVLGKTVQFKDLGLLIIDEEQKFGVGAKETLRNLKTNIDTLTLTATPIPRTLQFSLMSARDLSIMATPPANRQPVHTELVALDDERIRDIVNYEIYRGGQVFFVHNRVKDLISIAAMLQRLCPDVTVGIAHGQISNEELEDHMLKFISGRYDILVSTNIIESGLDVPNANTIIINNAHWFGLSDLHQLRGRVGRSNRKAFCYLVSPAIHTLPDDSRKRLRSIEQLSELGSGFQIAMRDLDIRGAGNILGGEQSGFIADIGFDMYQKILGEAIRELKESDFKDVFAEQMNREQQFVGDVQIDTDMEMLIPPYYVANTAERLSLYTQLDNIATEEKLVLFEKELTDRFGKPPQQVRELFNAVRLRWVAKRLGFERVSLKGRKMRCYFVDNQESSYYNSDIFGLMMQYIQHHAKKSHLKEVKAKLLAIFEDIHSIQQARTLLNEIATYVLPKEKTSKQ